MSDHLWYPEVQQALRSSSHLFLHYCAFHRVDEDGQTILEELRENGYMPECFDLSRIGTFSPLGDTNVVILLQTERLRETPRALEQIRFSVNEWATSSGGNVLIVSRSPRSAFPIGDGSSLVLDSRDLHLKASRFADWIVADFETNHGPAPEGAAHSRGLAEKLLSGRCRDDLSLLPGLVSDTACKTIFEMGPYYIAWLEEWVFECGMTCIPVVDVQEWMQSELILAGVARLDLDQQKAPRCIKWVWSGVAG